MHCGGIFSLKYIKETARLKKKSEDLVFLRIIQKLGRKNYYC